MPPKELKLNQPIQKIETAIDIPIDASNDIFR